MPEPLMTCRQWSHSRLLDMMTIILVIFYFYGRNVISTDLWLAIAVPYAVTAVVRIATGSVHWPWASP